MVATNEKQPPPHPNSGRDTKLSLNAREPPSKFSTIENRLNRIIAGVFGFKIVLISALTVGHGIWNNNNSEGAWYVATDEDAVLNMVKVFFSFFVLLSYLIPISLMVTYEVSKSWPGNFHVLGRKDEEQGRSYDAKNVEFE